MESEHIQGMKLNGAMGKKLVPILIIIALGAIIFEIVHINLSSFGFPRIAGNRWQAVFLSNDQVYFGHLDRIGRDYVRLTDIYYLRINQVLQPETGGVPDLNLIKLGNELHGPEDSMFIPTSQILFWENLRENSQVVRAIVSSTIQQAP